MWKLGWIVVLAACACAFGQGKAAEDTSTAVSEMDLEVPAGRVWEVFTTEEGFKKLGVAKAKIDFRVGGSIQSHYSAQGVLGDEGTIENAIIAYEPGRVFAFRISKPPKGFPFMNAYKDVWSVATITDLGGGRSHLRLAMCGYTGEEESQKMRGFFVQGNAWTLEKLKKNLEAPPADAADRMLKVIERSEATRAVEKSDPLAPIECEAVIAAMPEDVWKCWTTVEGVKSIGVEDANVELRIGGAYEFYFSKEAPAGERGSEGCTVLSFEPRKMLSFTWNAPPKFAYARGRRTWVVVNIEAFGPHSTKVRLKHMGFAEEAGLGHAGEWGEVREYFAGAWPRVLGAIGEKYSGKGG